MTKRTSTPSTSTKSRSQTPKSALAKSSSTGRSTARSRGPKASTSSKGSSSSAASQTNSAIDSPPWNESDAQPTSSPTATTTKKSHGTAGVVTDAARRTALVVSRLDGEVAFIALDVENGLTLDLTSESTFDERWKPLVDYPVEKCAALYASYARTLGATGEAIDALAKFTTVTKEDREMATAKKAARAKNPVAATKRAPAAKKEGTAKKSAPAAKSASGATTKSPDAPATKKERAPRGPTASGRFQELIMEGKKTDSEIFAIVQKEFNLSDDKRGYVKWYRNHLAKTGKNPPPAKQEK